MVTGILWLPATLCGYAYSEVGFPTEVCNWYSGVALQNVNTQNVPQDGGDKDIIFPKERHHIPNLQNRSPSNHNTLASIAVYSTEEARQLV